MTKRDRLLARFRRWLPFAVALALIAAAPAHSAPTQRAADVAINLFAFPPLVDGPAPPLHPADYQSYLGKGTGTLTFPVAVQLKGGGTVTPDGPALTFVYPYTAFTAWLVTTFAKEQDGVVGRDREAPGSHGFPVAVPTYLLPAYEPAQESERVVRIADACERGVCMFRHLRPGRYLVVSQVFIRETHLESNNGVAFNTEHGEIEPYSDPAIEIQTTRAGFVLIGQQYVTLSANTTVQGLPTFMRVAAYWPYPSARR